MADNEYMWKKMEKLTVQEHVFYALKPEDVDNRALMTIFGECAYFLRARSFDIDPLYECYSKKSPNRYMDSRAMDWDIADTKIFDWTPMCRHIMQTPGISFISGSVHVINGKKVCFYDTYGGVYSEPSIEVWLNKFFPVRDKAGRRCHGVVQLGMFANHEPWDHMVRQIKQQ
jgi:hypothetical protein